MIIDNVYIKNYNALFSKNRPNDGMYANIY